MTKVLKQNLFCFVLIIAAFAMIGKGPTTPVCVRLVSLQAPEHYVEF